MTATNQAMGRSALEGVRRAYVTILALDGQIARQAFSGFSPGEVTELGSNLKRVIANTSSARAEFWSHTERCVS